MKKYLFILTFLLTGFLYGQEINTARFENVVKSLKIDRSKIKEEFCTEKKMPNAENSYIIVIPVIIEQFEEDYIFKLQNYILITDEKGMIKNKYLDPAELTSDAVMLMGIGIDTGLYTISNGIRAFGVTVDFKGSSNPNPYSSGSISLYYPEGKTLRKVLDQFELNVSRGEWDTRCEGEFEDNHSYIIVDRTKSHHFTDLKIKTVSVKSINTFENEECHEKETSKTTYRTLKFRNGKYQ
ncbi:MAG: hypothetical protein LBE92_00200 [Chryseobacterium sp.]|jgi:hypothetical protein|uniref:hypothetical protein n=1 Tax=Chryseobacterium sp. TaxID=1871047 RepID=UPI00283945FF|nr:hypothetical protein [Chryseobacterium sp.]MDR2234518.1 hypothetical protein [Chryseobacterium sp.]